MIDTITDIAVLDAEAAQLAGQIEAVDAELADFREYGHQPKGWHPAKLREKAALLHQYRGVKARLRRELRAHPSIHDLAWGVVRADERRPDLLKPAIAALRAALTEERA